MGEFADLTIDRDWSDYWDDRDVPDYEPDIDVVYEEIIKYKDFPSGTDILLRKYKNSKYTSLVINMVCNIVKTTDKAVLFHVDKEEHKDYADQLFWVPKSVLYMKKNEAKVVYVKSWVQVINQIKLYNDGFKEKID